MNNNTILNREFKTGKLLQTSGIRRACESVVFNSFIWKSIERHKNNDWGDCCADDWKANDEAIDTEARIFSVYKVPEKLKEISRSDKIWIITEADSRDSTTILFPNEY